MSQNRTLKFLKSSPSLSTFHRTATNPCHFEMASSSKDTRPARRLTCKWCVSMRPSDDPENEDTLHLVAMRSRGPKYDGYVHILSAAAVILGSGQSYIKVSFVLTRDLVLR